MPNPLDVFVDPGAGVDSPGNGSIGSPYQTTQYAYTDTSLGTDGTRFNIKVGATDTTGNTPLTLSNGTPDAPLYIQGYTATAGDGGRGHIDTGTVSLLAAGYNYFHVQDMEITANTANIGVYSSLVNNVLNCSPGGTQYTKIIGNTINGNVTLSSQGSDCRYNKITHSSGWGITINGQSACHHNVIISQSGATGAILLSGHDSEAANNSCYASAAVTHGIRGDDASFVVGAYNNLVQGYTTAFSNVTNVNKSQMFCNSSFGHTTLESFAAEPWYQSTHFDNTALAESPFVDAAGSDFTPKNITGVNNGLGAFAIFRGAMNATTGGGGAAFPPIGPGGLVF